MAGFLSRGHWLEEFFLVLKHFAHDVLKRRDGAVLERVVSGHGAAWEMQCCQEAQLINEELGY